MMFNFSPYPYTPQTPVFIPNPPQQQNPFEQVDSWIRGLKALKESMKEEKKEDHKKKEPKILSDANVLGLILLCSIPVGIGQLLLLAAFKEAVLKLMN